MSVRRQRQGPERKIVAADSYSSSADAETQSAVRPERRSQQALNFLASWSAQASPANPRESETIQETK